MKKLMSLCALATLFLTLPLWSAPTFSDYQLEDLPERVQKEILRVVDLPSCYEGIDGMVRKSREERVQDEIKWYKRAGFVNGFYNQYGLDIKDFRNMDDIITGKQMDRYAIHHKNIDPKKHKDILDNKLIFDSIVRSVVPEAIPKLHFMVQGNLVKYPEEIKMTTLDAIQSLDNGIYMCKPLDGAQGKGIFKITKISDDNINIKHITKGNISLEEFPNSISKSQYIIQDFIYQHDALNKLNPYSVNTVRIVTTRFNEDVHVLGASLRMGTVKNSFVDNASAGGIFVGINDKIGTLKRYGCSERNVPIVLDHPLTHVTFDGYQLPYWNEVIDLVKKLHPYFYQQSSIGWDIAITPYGPMVIEGNTGYDLMVLQFAHGGIKPKWEQLKIS